VLLVLVLGGAGAAIATTLSGGKTSKATTVDRDLTLATFPGYRLSFRYPRGWHREDWCWLGTNTFPLTLLTTAKPPRCQAGNVFGFQSPLPPPQRIGSHGVAAWWAASGRRSMAVANARVGGRPAHISVTSEPTRRTPHSYVNCVGAGKTQRRLTAVIQGPSSRIRAFHVGAVICGPDFAAGEADVRKMLASVHFAD
jgi:hypothetical protein